MLTSNDERANPRDRLIDAFQRRGGVLTRRDIAALGFGSDTLQQLLKSGNVVRAAHGLYRLSEAAPFGSAALAQACLAIPSGVVALQSALAYFELTTQIVPEVEIAVSRHVPRKRVEIPLRIIQMPLSRFASNVLRVRTEEGDRFRIFSAERTVCDCFAYPKIVPEHIAYEGLRTYLDSPNAHLQNLAEQAALTNTEQIIIPVIRARVA
jgi:predicted transcriptional regulator of viral defense system